MALLDELQRMADEKRYKGLHPLVKKGYALSIRDAYFRGIVLAALVDDGRIDEEERKFLDKIRLGMDLDREEATEIVDELVALSVDENKMLTAVSETVSCLCDAEAVRLFFAEFTQIWLSHASDEGKLREWRLALLGLMGYPIAAEWLGGLDDAIRSRDPEKIMLLGEFGEDDIVFLFGRDIADIVSVLRGSTAAEQPAGLGTDDEFKRLVIERFEGQGEFSRDDLLSDFQANGGMRHFIHSVLQVVIPYMKSLLPMIERDIPLLVDNGGSPRKVMLCQSMSVKRFCRAFDAAMMCIDVCNDRKIGSFRLTTAIKGTVDRKYSFEGKCSWQVQIDEKQWDLDTDESVMKKVSKELDDACKTLYAGVVQKIEGYAKYF